MSKIIGIIGWGSYIPSLRLPLTDLAKARNVDPKKYLKGLILEKMALPQPYEDAVTMAFEAAKNALDRSKVNPEDIGIVVVGTESKPYSVKSVAGIIKDLLGCSPYAYVGDYDAACAGGIQAIVTCAAFIKSGLAKFGLAVASDISEYEFYHPGEPTQGAGAAAFVIGKGNVDVSIENFVAYSTDTNDFFRRSEERYPFVYGHFSEEAYLEHVIKTHEKIVSTRSPKPDYYAFHLPFGKMALKASKRIGLDDEEVERKVKPSFEVVKATGNQYAASILNVVIHFLENMVNVGERIEAISYGSGAQSIGIIFKVEHDLKKKVNLAPTLNHYLRKSKLVDVKYYEQRRRNLKEKPLIFGKIEPNSTNGVKRFICENCGMLLSPYTIKKCPRCYEKGENFRLREIFYPFKAKLLSFEETEKDVFEEMLKGKIRILEEETENLKVGMDLKLKVIKLKVEGKNGLIHYGPAYEKQE
ncbi:hydroxymethylglutaryl-CoA synthase [Candidatus Bathyarchaeota archaeon]|nr:MAG: hydroxymethylglutaryl-CoA synthase [Candidatus Bathyarchaeota archaeon]